MKRFERSETTSALVRYLRECEKGTRVSYKDLSEIAGLTVTSRTSYLITARHILERESAHIWVCIAPGICLYRLNDPEIAERHRNWYLSGARNKLVAGSRQADIVELDKLNLQEQARFATDSIIREIARDALARSMHRRIEKVARGTSNDLPAFSAVEWMINLSPKRSATRGNTD